MNHHPEATQEIFDLALSIQLPGETVAQAFVRAQRLHLIKSAKEQRDFMERLRYVPTCKSEVYDPDMFGYTEEGDCTFIEGHDEEEA